MSCKNKFIVLLLIFTFSSNIYAFRLEAKVLNETIKIINSTNDVRIQLENIKELAVVHNLNPNYVIKHLKEYIDSAISKNEKKLYRKYNYNSLTKGVIYGLIGLTGLRITHYLYKKFKKDELDALSIYNNISNLISQNTAQLMQLNGLAVPTQIAPNILSSQSVTSNFNLAAQLCLMQKNLLSTRTQSMQNQLTNLQNQTSLLIVSNKKWAVTSELIGASISLISLSLSLTMFYDAFHPQFKENYKKLLLLKEKVNKINEEFKP